MTPAAVVGELVAKWRSDAEVLIADELALTGGIQAAVFKRCADQLQATLSALTAEAGKGDEWRCFHCDEAFTDSDSAAVHFGTHEHQRPACLVDAAEYRRMEAKEARYAEEDADCHRAMHRQQTEHNQALQRAEEAGYAKGLRDSGKCPCALSTATPAGEWREIESAPKDQQIVMAYFGEDKNLDGFACIGHFFQWESMPGPLPTGWPWRTLPTHWAPLAASPRGASESGHE